MDGEKFFDHLSAIVGANNARLYSKRFGPLNDKQYGEILNFEALAFYVYTTSLNWHNLINDQLWSDAPTLDVCAFRDVLNNALLKLPVHRTNGGIVYRGYHASDLRSFLERYEPGSTVHFPGFTSAAFKEEHAFGGNVLFIIRALTARAVWFLSANFHECEVLIPAGRDFAVMSTIHQGNRAVISLEEIG
jgi:hypothetical protein